VSEAGKWHHKSQEGIAMAVQTDNAPSQRSGPKTFLADWRTSRPRFAVNVFRVVVGVCVLASIHWAGPLALLGLVPLAWAAVVFRDMHRRQRRAHN
jgi:hypothetical protein